MNITDISGKKLMTFNYGDKQKDVKTNVHIDKLDNKNKNIL